MNNQLSTGDHINPGDCLQRLKGKEGCCIKFETILKFLIDEEILQGGEFIPHIKPGHGSCCTCQTCGYIYDNCVCSHNERLGKLLKLRDDNA